jgi:hypothetical protein
MSNVWAKLDHSTSSKSSVVSLSRSGGLSRSIDGVLSIPALQISTSSRSPATARVPSMMALTPSFDEASPGTLSVGGRGIGGQNRGHERWRARTDQWMLPPCSLSSVLASSNCFFVSWRASSRRPVMTTRAPLLASEEVGTLRQREWSRWQAEPRADGR